MDSYEEEGSFFRIYYLQDQSLLQLLQKNMKNSILVFIGISILNIVLVMLLGFRYILHPLEVLLVKAFGEIEKSNLSYRIPLTNKDGVFSDLYRKFNYMAERIDSLVSKELKQQILVNKANFKHLQAQINPHFLYNCLSLINNKALMNNQPEISQMSQLLSVFYRTTLNKGKSETLLQNEIKNVTSYIDIQRLLHDNIFDVMYQIDPNLPEIEVPNLLLQPLVENSIIHGILPNKTKRGQLFVTVTNVMGQIYFTIMDNGVGIPQEKLSTLLTTDSSGYGLKNVHDRLILAYGEGSGLTINSIPGQSTMITFKVPV